MSSPINMRVVTPTVVVDRRSYDRYRDLRRLLFHNSGQADRDRLRHQVLALHWDFFYAGKPVRTPQPVRVSHPLWGTFTGVMAETEEKSA